MRLSLRRPVTDYDKVQRAIGAVARNRQIFNKALGSGCYVNLGCGPNTNSNFVNLDYNWRPGIDVCWDVTRGLPFSDGHCGGLFTEHMLEHLEFDEACALLHECARVLQPGATIRVVVPDGEIYLNEYAKHRRGDAAAMPYGADDRASHPRATPMYSINRIFRHHGHKFIWDAETLIAELIAAGFQDAEKMSFRRCRDPLLVLDTPQREIESLYVDATRG